MSSRQTKKAALAALRERRAGLSAASSKLEEYTVADEGDVYDVVDEAEYEELVEKRRQREDFVVDDGEYMCLYMLRYMYALFGLEQKGIYLFHLIIMCLLCHRAKLTRTCCMPTCRLLPLLPPPSLPPQTRRTRLPRRRGGALQRGR